jgi:hypothetical protein
MANKHAILFQKIKTSFQITNLCQSPSAFYNKRHSDQTPKKEEKLMTSLWTSTGKNGNLQPTHCRCAFACTPTTMGGGQIYRGKVSYD